MATKGTVGQLLVSMRADLSGLKVDVQEMQKTFENSFKTIQASATEFARNITSAFGIGLSITAVVGYARSIINLAGNLKDLSEQTGISAQALSGIKSTLEENGVSVEAFAKSMFNLQKNLGTIKDATDPVAQAIKALGLNYKELQQLNTEELVKKITDAFGKQTNELQRNAIAGTLVGKSAREAIVGLIALAGHFDELKKKGISQEDIDKLDEFGDAMTRLKDTMEILTAGPLSKMVQGLQEILRIFGLMERVGADKFGQLEDRVKNLSTELSRSLAVSLGEVAQASADKLLEWAKNDATISKIVTSQVDALLKARKELNDFVAKNPLGTGPEGGPKQRSTFTPFLEDPKIKSALETLQKTLAAVQAEEIALTQGKGAAEKWKLEHELMAELNVKKLTPSFQKLIDQIVAVKNRIDDFRVRQEAQKNIIEEQTDRTTKLTEATQGYEKVLEELDEGVLTSLQQSIKGVNDQYYRQIAALLEIKRQRGGDVSRELAQAEEQRFKRLGELGKDLRNQVTLGSVVDDSKRQMLELVMVFSEQARNIRALGAAEGRPEAETEALVERARKNLVLAMKKVETPARQFGENIGESISSGIRNTLMGIETGQQTIGQGLKNLLQNIGLELQFAIYDQTILKPIKEFTKGFVTEFFSSMNDNFAKEAAKWGEKLAKQLKQWLSSVAESAAGGGSSGGGGFLGGLLGLFGGLFGSKASSPSMTDLDVELSRARGGPIPAFASGGLFIGHGGEYVLQKSAVNSIGRNNLDFMNSTGNVPGGGVTNNYIDARGAQKGVDIDIMRAINVAENRAVDRSVTAVADRRRRSNTYAKTFGG